MLFVIDKVLTAEELAHIRGKFGKARFGDAWVTAGELAAQVKHNLQLPEGEAETRALARLVIEALQRSPLFVSAALPRTVYPPLFNRYLPGMDFAWARRRCAPMSRARCFYRNLTTMRAERSSSKTPSAPSR